ncbi:MAG TPA: TadE/TadG family type IV pilus assembly protein [Terriglobia bacterium]|nr:TadE/TadG family type IV pilus assembly protein [Terriglobia bacterium]
MTSFNHESNRRRTPARSAVLRLRLRQATVAEEGSQVLEFAMVLPFLLVFILGIIDFGGAFTLKQKMANAAREGARTAISNTLSDSSCTSSTPCSIQAAADAVSQYMTGAGQNSSCINPSSPSASGTLNWTYSCSNGIQLVINKGYIVTASAGAAVSATEVTLTYPYTWTFNDVIGLLVHSNTVHLPSRLTTRTVMENLVAN